MLDDCTTLYIDPEIDEGIRKLLIDLNKNGLTTAFSCEGHKVKSNGWVATPYISFVKVLDKSDKKLVQNIFERHGLSGIRSPQFNYRCRNKYNEAHTRITWWNIEVEPELEAPNFESIISPLITYKYHKFK